MADVLMVDGEQNSVVDTIEIFYTAIAPAAGGKGAKITAFSAANNGTASASYKGYIYDAFGASTGAIIPLKVIVKDRFDLGHSIVGQLIPAGGTLRMESSSLNTIEFRVTGKELD